MTVDKIRDGPFLNHYQARPERGCCEATEGPAAAPEALAGHSLPSGTVLLLSTIANMSIHACWLAAPVPHVRDPQCQPESTPFCWLPLLSPASTRPYAGPCTASARHSSVSSGFGSCFIPPPPLDFSTGLLCLSNCLVRALHIFWTFVNIPLSAVRFTIVLTYSNLSIF